MKKYFSRGLLASFIIASVFGFSLFINVTPVKAQSADICSLVNLLIMINVIPADKVNAARTAFNCSVPVIPLVQPSITVLSPNGGETIEIGQKYNITWNTKNTNNITVVLINDSIQCRTGIVGCQNSFTIYSGKNTGSYLWDTNKKMFGGSTGPNSVSVVPGSQYKIGVYATGESGMGDISDSYFKIVSKPVTPTPSITVLSPNGGESLKMGETYKISWKAVGLSNNVEIYIRDERAGPSYKLIATEIHPEKFEYSWTVPVDFWGIYTAGDSYKIQVRQLGGKAGGGPNEGVYDESDSYFKIVSKPIINQVESETFTYTLSQGLNPIAMNFIPVDDTIGRLFYGKVKGGSGPGDSDDLIFWEGSSWKGSIFYKERGMPTNQIGQFIRVSSVVNDEKVSPYEGMMFRSRDSGTKTISIQGYRINNLGATSKITIKEGLTLTGIPFVCSGRNPSASEVITHINRVSGNKCYEIMNFNTSKNDWTEKYDLKNSNSRDNFQIVANRAYFVRCEAGMQEFDYQGFSCSVSGNVVSTKPIINNPTHSFPAASTMSLVNTKTSYEAGQIIKYSVKAVNSFGSPGSPEKGFNVQWRLDNTDGGNATYNPKTYLWEIVITAPSDTSKKYTMDTIFYCSHPNQNLCAENQINKTFTFSLNSQIPDPIVSESSEADAMEARDAKRVSDIQQIQRALEQYKNDKGFYPAVNLSMENSSSETYRTRWAKLNDELVNNQYITKLPTDPKPSTGFGAPWSNIDAYGYLYYTGDSFANCTQGQWYTLVYRLEKDKRPDLGPGITKCSDGTIWRPGKNTAGLVTTGVGKTSGSASINSTGGQNYATALYSWETILKLIKILR